MITRIQANIGSGNFMPDGDSPFLLSKPEFIAVQTYVEAGKRLPGKVEELQLKLGISKADAEQFSDLIAVYSQVVSHCQYFSDTTFPATVGLASDIVHYNTKVPIYYGALMPIIEMWQDGRLSPEKAKAKLAAILANLRTTAQSYAHNAATAKEKIHQFVEDTKQDKGNLEPIQQRYKDQYQGEGGEVDTLRKQIEHDKVQIEHWNAKYKHDVAVAASSPAYAWIWPFGTAAAAIVAGVYGKRASDDLDRVHEFQKKLKEARKDLQQAVTLMSDLGLARDSLEGILTELNTALPVLERIEGTWDAIAKDLNNILSVITEDIEEAPVIIKDLGVTTAIEDWAKVAAIAEQYRANAYITVTTEAEIQKNAASHQLVQVA